MSGSNALTIPRDPTVLVNPLAAVDAGTQSAGLVYDLRQKQANEAAGQAYQGAINQQTGEFDPNEFRRRLAASGPAAMAAGAALMNTQQISSDQLKQSLEKQKWINSTAGALLQAGDFSDAAMLGALHNGVAGHILTLPEAQAQLATMPSDAAGRQRWLQVHQDTSASFQEQMNQRYGTPFRENIGGQIVGGVQNQRGGGSLSTGSGPLTVTPTPGEALQGGYHYPATQADVDAGRAKSVGQDIYIPGAEVYRRAGLPVPPGLLSGGGGGGGVVDNTGKPVSGANPPRLLNVPNQPPAPAAYQGTGTGGPTDTVPIYQPPAGTPPAAPAASQPPGPRSSLEGGVQVASANALQAPTVGAAGPPSPLVPGDVNAILAGMNQRRAAGSSSGTQTAFNTIATGPGTEEAAGYKASADKLAADDAFAAEWQKTQFPYVQALKNYGEGTKTGPTTEFWNQVAGTIRTPLAKLGINIGPLADTTERVDSLGKWLSNILPNARSDAELANVLKGSASTHINEVAGEDMVKAGFALGRMKIALNNDWHNNPALQAQYGTYQRYLGDMNNKIDPRAFMVDILNDKGDNNQKTRLIAQLTNGSEADAARFEASLALARRTGQIGGAGSQAMP